MGIVTFNSAATLRATVESLVRAGRGFAAFEILLRDNGSRDATAELARALAAEYPEVTCLPGDDNIGYGCGHNDILRQSRGDPYVVCNPDVVVPENFFDASLQFLDSYPDAAVMSPRMVAPDGTLQHSNRRHPNLLVLVVRRFLPRALRKLADPAVARYEMRDMGYDRVGDVPFCSGALMVCRRQALDQVAGFDPRYFLYFEDADLSRALQHAGWRTLFNPDVEIVHHWHRGAHKNWRLTVVMMRNGARYFNKWGWKLF